MARLTIQCLQLLIGALLITFVVGCSAPRHNTLNATAPYYNYQFTSAREALRGPTETTNDQNVILNNVRLGLAAMADGDAQEAERTFSRVFELLSTAGLNKDRTTAAVLLNEGVKVFKGEPFEQALTYHWIATLYATQGDWENARAAAANSIFRLTDFIGDTQPGGTTPDGLDYRIVESNFALGFIMQAIASDLSNAPGMQEQLDAALKINPALESIVQTLRSRDYDTLFIIDFGRGPSKQTYGPDESLVRFVPAQQWSAHVTVEADGEEVALVHPVCDVNAMAEDLRWNDLENVRKAKSAAGNVLLVGGLTAVAVGAHNRSEEAVLAGLGAAAVGLLSKSAARGDTRYIDFAPQLIFLVPVNLGGTRTVSINVHSNDVTTYIMPGFVPGSAGNAVDAGRPRAVYLRLHGPHAMKPAWMTAKQLVYGNDAAGVTDGDWPWILGGRDVSTPTRESLARYQQHGHCTDLTINDLLELYRAEDILIGSGMETRPERLRNPSYRHILDGGTGLFTPMEWSMGYKRLMFMERPAYKPRSIPRQVNGMELEP